MAQTLAKAKENIWIYISEAINEILTSVQINFEDEEMIQRSKTLIEEVREMLGKRLGESTTLIKVLNSKTIE